MDLFAHSPLKTERNKTEKKEEILDMGKPPRFISITVYNVFVHRRKQIDDFVPISMLKTVERWGISRDAQQSVVVCECGKCGKGAKQQQKCETKHYAATTVDWTIT